jgi:hypothetical protein
MPEHLHHHDYADGDLVNPETRHEDTDVNVRALLWFVVIFIVFGVVTHFVLLMMYHAFRQIETVQNNEKAPMTALQRPADAAIPPEPRLQPFPNKERTGVMIAPNRNTPVTDLQDMRAREQQILDNYGWVDPQKGVVHIPVEDAKKLAMQRGLFPLEPTSNPDPLAEMNVSMVPPGNVTHGAVPATSTSASPASTTSPAPATTTAGAHPQ